MITFYIKKNPFQKGEFAYDLRALAGSFFPEEKCEVIEREEWSDESGYPLLCFFDEEKIIDERLPFTYTKNTVKQVVYIAFSKKSGKVLPWGILTGIRPAKIPLRLMMKGWTKEEISQTLEDEYFVTSKKVQLAIDVATNEYGLMEHFNHPESYNLYIGMPFCPTICGYCSFSAYDIKTFKNRVDAYLDALEKEMVYVAKKFENRKLNSIYVGGGTPTSLNEEQFERLLTMIDKHLPVEQSEELTVEAGRPDSITEQKLIAMKNHNVTRISVNPQTMKQATLDILGRKHTVDEVVEIFKLARKLGFDNINMDLIVGLPEETKEDFEKTLSEVKKLDPDSVTIHTLVIKRASRMRREQLDDGDEIRNEDLIIPQLQQSSYDFLKAAGYEPYYMYRQKNKAGSTRNTNQENVAYAKPGKECLYNIFIMEELETIVAIGSGGSTKVVYPEENRMERIENVKSVDDYIARIDEMIERKEIALDSKK